MLKLRTALALILLVSCLGIGCSYAGVAVSADGKKAVVLRNDWFLWGAIRKAYVCDVTDGGLVNCQHAQKP